MKKIYKQYKKELKQYEKQVKSNINILSVSLHSEVEYISQERLYWIDTVGVGVRRVKCDNEVGAIFENTLFELTTREVTNNQEDANFLYDKVLSKFGRPYKKSEYKYGKLAFDTSLFDRMLAHYEDGQYILCGILDDYATFGMYGEESNYPETQEFELNCLLDSPLSEGDIVDMVESGLIRDSIEWVS